MDYQLVSFEQMKTEIENRLRILETQHYAASVAIEEFEVLGEEYDQFKQTEVEKMVQFEKVIEFLRAKLDELT